jgi:hypothetical protein
MFAALLLPVIPAQAGIQGNCTAIRPWMPAFAGMTKNKPSRWLSSQSRFRTVRCSIRFSYDG